MSRSALPAAVSADEETSCLSRTASHQPSGFLAPQPGDEEEGGRRAGDLQPGQRRVGDSVGAERTSRRRTGGSLRVGRRRRVWGPREPGMGLMPLRAGEGAHSWPLRLGVCRGQGLLVSTQS